jgi:hypothetical protein
MTETQPKIKHLNVARPNDMEQDWFDDMVKIEHKVNEIIDLLNQLNQPKD